MVKGQCMKCKKQVEIKDGKDTISPGKANPAMSTKMIKGKCPECDTTVCRITGRIKTADIKK
ncbi:MAG: hypothetical protein QF475_00285 [Candidatus Undinarchaeales archaeon]|jgi:endogenous inhibitor of DNA gyrase (YacG/DUF329 family)|nr:hypothetical protein [Candidatus Undinarchaeales archaeon]